MATSNALAALAVGIALGVPLVDGAAALREAVVSAWRMETFVNGDGITVVNDAYNASPSSMRAALESFAGLAPSGRRIAVLGDMLELGAASAEQHRVVGRLAGTLGLDAPANFTAGGSSVTVTRGARATNGTATPSFTIEVAHLDLDKAQIYTGCVINTMDLNLAIGQLATVTLGIEAQSSTRQDTFVGSSGIFITGATYTAAATHPTLDPIGVAEIRVGGADYAAQSLTLNLTNNARAREQIGSLGPVSMARGFFGATGSVTAYLADWTDHNAFAGNTPTDLWFAAIDANGRGWSMSLPQVKFSDVNAPVQGNNTDVFKNISVTAYKDPTESCTVRLQRWD